MKNTKLMRLLLITVAAAMILSLFACDFGWGDESTESESNIEKSTHTPNNNDPEETDSEDTVNSSADTTEEASEESSEESSEEKSEESSEESSKETSEESTEESSEETTVCEHVEEVVEGTPATCEKDGLTDGQKCSVCGETIVEQDVIPATGHAWDEGVVTKDPECENVGVKTYTCANDEAHTKTEAISALGHTPEVVPGTPATCEGDGISDGQKCSACGNTLVAQTVVPATGHGTEGETWKYISNKGTAYEGTRYAVEGAECNTCHKITETRAAVIAFNIGGMNLANENGVAYDPQDVMGSGFGEMVTDPTKRVTPFETIYLRNNQFVVAAGWVGINGDFDTTNGYYRILDENGEPLTDWVAKSIANTTEQEEGSGAYGSVKNQLAAHGVTNFVARGFKTNNLNVIIDEVDYAKYDKPISIEYALRSTDAPEGSDLITLVVFKNAYKVCTSHSCDWQYVSGVGTEWEGTGYAVQGGTCKNCGEYVTRAAVVAFNFDSVAAADKNGTGIGLTGIGTGGGAMVTNPDARVTTLDAIYLRSNQFLMAQGWIGVAGEMDINNAYYRILNNETGEVILDWQQKVISDSSSSSVRPQVKPETAGSYGSAKNQLNAQGITDGFTVYGFRSNNLVTKINGTEYASKDTPIAIEYAVKIVGAPEGYDLIRVIIFQNVYMY